MNPSSREDLRLKNSDDVSFETRDRLVLSMETDPDHIPSLDRLTEALLQPLADHTVSSPVGISPHPEIGWRRSGYPK